MHVRARQSVVEQARGRLPRFDAAEAGRGKVFESRNAAINPRQFPSELCRQIGLIESQAMPSQQCPPSSFLESATHSLHFVDQWHYIPPKCDRRTMDRQGHPPFPDRVNVSSRPLSYRKPDTTAVV